jgi:hypothetical protein
LKKKSKNLLACVIYKGVEPYLSDLLQAISLQTSKNFDLLILNDGVFNFPELSDHELNIIEIKSESFQTASLNRKRCIDYAKKNNYITITFCDADDLPSPNYVEEILHALKTNDFAFCDLHPFEFDVSEKSSSFLSNYISSNEILLNDIIDRNLIGLGHSGMKVESVLNIQLLDELIAVDWYLFSIMMLKGLIGEFIDRPLVNYRQSSLNTVGVIKKVSKESVLRGVNVKEIHYKAMLYHCLHNNYFEKKVYSQKYEEIKELKIYLKNSKNLSNYTKVLNNNLSSIFCGWWSEILSLNKFKKYD